MGLASILAWWTGGNQFRIIGLMRQSGLNNRKKWDRPDYLPRTVRNAIINCTSFYGDGSYTSTADGLETEYAKVKAKEKSGVITSITEDNGDFTPHTCLAHKPRCRGDRPADAGRGASGPAAGRPGSRADRAPKRGIPTPGNNNSSPTTSCTTPSTRPAGVGPSAPAHAERSSAWKPLRTARLSSGSSAADVAPAVSRSRRGGASRCCPTICGEPSMPGVGCSSSPPARSSGNTTASRLTTTPPAMKSTATVTSPTSPSAPRPSDRRSRLRPPWTPSKTPSTAPSGGPAWRQLSTSETWELPKKPDRPPQCRFRTYLDPASEETKQQIADNCDAEIRTKVQPDGELGDTIKQQTYVRRHGWTKADREYFWAQPEDGRRLPARRYARALLRAGIARRADRRRRTRRNTHRG